MLKRRRDRLHGADRARSRKTGSAALVLSSALAAGCAAALHEPPALVELARVQEPATPAAAPFLLAQAEGLFTTRSGDAVREAVSIFFAAASADCAGDGTGPTRCALRVSALVGAARAQIWIVEHADDRATRRQAAKGAVHAAQWCVRLSARDAECDYWLGAALGVQAREKRSTGLSALPQIVAAFSRAAAAQPLLEEAGPDRALALLYLRAPGWPTGPGDAALGLQHAEKAVHLAPGSPANHLALAEAHAAAGDATGRRAALQQALNLARQRAQRGDPDAAEWIASAQAALADQEKRP